MDRPVVVFDASLIDARLRCLPRLRRQQVTQHGSPRQGQQEHSGYAGFLEGSEQQARLSMKLERIARMPDWPARMDEVMASDYLGVGVTTFRDRVRLRQYPQAVREGGRLLWSRRQLDLFVESQFGIATASEGSSWDDSV